MNTHTAPEFKRTASFRSFSQSALLGFLIEEALRISIKKSTLLKMQLTNDNAVYYQEEQARLDGQHEVINSMISFIKGDDDELGIN